MSFEQNPDQAMTYRELLGRRQLTEADFPLGASFEIDEAREQLARHQVVIPAVLEDGCMTFRELLLAPKLAEVMPREDILLEGAPQAA